jgi:hypothetical protein
MAQNFKKSGTQGNILYLAPIGKYGGRSPKFIWARIRERYWSAKIDDISL